MPERRLRPSRCLDVLDLRAPVVERDRRDVEPHPLDAAHPRERASPVLVGGTQQRRPLLCVDAGERPGERAGPARPHLDDDHERVTSRDDVELERPDAHVSPQDLEPTREQQLGDRLLRPLSAPPPRGQAAVIAR